MEPSKGMDNMEQIKILLRLIKYGWLLEYHMKKKDIISLDHKTVLNYHFEMAQHYYKQIYKKEPTEKR